jgi:hypothetical protein
MVRNQGGGKHKHIARNKQLKKSNSDGNANICKFKSMTSGNHGKGIDKNNNSIDLIFRDCMYNKRRLLKEGVYLEIITGNTNTLFEVSCIVSNNDERIIEFERKLSSISNTNTQMAFDIMSDKQIAKTRNSAEICIEDGNPNRKYIQETEQDVDGDENLDDDNENSDEDSDANNSENENPKCAKHDSFIDNI